MQIVRVKRENQVVKGYCDGDTLILDNGEKILMSKAEFAPPGGTNKNYSNAS